MDREAALALLREQHAFPGDHPFHVIVRQDEAAITRVSSALAACVGLPTIEGRVTRVPSGKGTYVSLRLKLPCAAAEAVLDVYATLAALPDVVRYL